MEYNDPRLIERIREELTPISESDLDAQYDEMLDDCYSFESVGGIFAGMTPSRVLQLCDETAYRCGFNDYLDGLIGDSITEEIDGDYWDLKEVDEIKEELEEAIEVEENKEEET